MEMSRCRDVEMSKCPNVELLYGDVEFWMSKCRNVEMLRCRDVERGQECWPRTLTDLLQAHENGGQRSQNGKKGLNSISSLKLPFL